MIRFGMALMEMVQQLTKGFVKATGRQPDNLEKLKIQQEAVQRFKDMNKVVDMEGNVIDTSKGIMGGKQIQENKEFGKALKEELMKTDNPFSDLVKTTEKGPKSLEQRRKEAEEALKNKNVVPIKDPEDMAQGGRAGFKLGTGKKGIQALLDLFKPKPKPKFDVERFREGPIDLKFLENIDKKDLAPFIRSRDTMGPGGYGMYDDFADMPAGLRAAELIKTIKGPRNEINYKAAELFLGKKLKGNESADELIQMLNRQEMRADGGRIGYKVGSVDKMRRLILKAMGAGTVGIGALKSGILGIGKGAGEKVAEEVVKKSTSTPPTYFFELANKIKTLGRVSDGPAERIKIHTMPAKDGKSELMLTEDIGTGEMQIKKIGKEEDMTTKVETMEYTPGSSQADEATQGIPADSYDEYTEFNSRIIKDEYNDPIVENGVDVKEIIEEVKDQAPSIKKAGGGIARMLGE